MLFASLLALPSASHPRRELQEDASDLFGSDEDVAQIMTPIRAVIRTSRWADGDVARGFSVGTFFIIFSDLIRFWCCSAFL